MLYNYIMKPVKPKLQKVRAKNGMDIFYAYSHWPTREIDGITFISVVKENSNEYQVGHWMKKDNMEYVK